VTEYPIGPISQIPKGEGRNFMVAERMIAVFHTRDGEVFATQAECPHLGGPLADGLTDARSVVCPLHDRVFSFETGAGIGNDCTVLVYPVRVSGDGVVVLSVQSD
jgi:nitrite reductase (NADH) small subunit